MYPPRKKPLPKTAVNTYKSAKRKENTYKRQPAAKGFNTKFILMAIGVGGLLALANNAGGNPNSSAPAPAGGGTTPATGGSTKPTTPTTPTPAPAPEPVVITVPTGSNKTYLVVDSWNGEGIYAGTKSNYTIDVGYGKGKILHLPNYRYIGEFTGNTQNNMLQAHIKINNVSYNVWVDKNEVAKLSLSEYQAHAAKYRASTSKTDDELRTIINYFNK